MRAGGPAAARCREGRQRLGGGCLHQEVPCLPRPPQLEEERGLWGMEFALAKLTSYKATTQLAEGDGVLVVPPGSVS